MAKVVFSDSFDFAHAPSWTVFFAGGAPTFLTIYDQTKDMTFYGAFTYSGSPSNPKVAGTVTQISLAINHFVVYDITDIKLDAAKLQQLVLTPNGAQQFYAYVLSGNDTISSRGPYTMGYAGNDTFVGPLSGVVDGGTGFDTYLGSTASPMTVDLTRLRITSTSGDEPVSVTLRAVEAVVGGNGNDTFIGSSGNDSMDGAIGIDTVSFAAVTTALQVDLSAGTSRGAGTDVVKRFENVIGGKAADQISGSAAANVLDGGAGADTLRGGAGNDTYVIDQSGDRIVESSGGGFDTVRSAVSYVLGSEFEHLVLTGSAATRGTGNAAANRLSGNVGGNALDGGSGADTLDGAGGADSLNGGSGADSLLGGDGNDQLLGGTDNDTLAGGVGNDTLDGGTGSDRLYGGVGDDLYRVDGLDSIVVDESGYDTVTTLSSFSLGSVDIEKLVLGGSSAINGTGSAIANLIIGNAANNLIDGQSGSDTMQGGAGNDTYVVGSSGDLIVELAGQGDDLVRSSVSEILAANVENLVLTGSANIYGTGNALDNVITGNAGANHLDGSTGADTMTGGAGDDTYVVEHAGDVLVEVEGGGRDTVRSTLNWTLASPFENLVLIGTAAINGTGNTRSNLLTGNGAVNRLDGRAGADTLVGGAGNDIYIVDSTGDQIVEIGDGGSDTVYSSVDWVLAANVESLVLQGSALNATGNDGDNRIVGTAGANRLVGGLGRDTLVGGAGDDTYNVDGGIVIEEAEGGYDTMERWGTLTLAAHVEKGVLLSSGILTGNTLGNLLDGSSGDDTFVGGGGADTMQGGAGSDWYNVDSLDDVVIEASNDTASLDRLITSLSVDTPVIGIEQYELLGSENLRVTAGAGSQRLYGNSGDNVLNGGAGADQLYGGLGSDVYYVDNVGDVVDESSFDGFDEVFSSVSVASGWTRIDRITLTGTANLSASISELGQIVAGNAGNNVLDGGRAGIVSFHNATGAVNVDLQAGTASGFGTDQVTRFRGIVGSDYGDTLRGGSDADSLTGGSGEDVFQFWHATADTVRDFASGVDRLAIDQSEMAIGNGDLLIDGVVQIDGPGGFGTDAELVLGASTTGLANWASEAAVAIGSASSAYSTGQSALFAVQGIGGIGIYRFVSSGEDALVQESELTLLTLLSGATSLTAQDLLWIG